MTLTKTDFRKCTVCIACALTIEMDFRKHLVPLRGHEKAYPYLWSSREWRTQLSDIKGELDTHPGSSVLISDPLESGEHC